MNQDRNLPAVAAHTRKLALTMADYAEVIKRPLRVLPEELRPAVLRLWVMHKHLAGMDSPLPLAGAITVWVEEHHLHPEDAEKIITGLQSPARMAEFKFASDLMTAMAQDVAMAISERKRNEERRQRWEESEVARKHAEANPPTEETWKKYREVREQLHTIAQPEVKPFATDPEVAERNERFARMVRNGEAA